MRVEVRPPGEGRALVIGPIATHRASMNQRKSSQSIPYSLRATSSTQGQITTTNFITTQSARLLCAVNHRLIRRLSRPII
jgi:hypothetical protein